MAVTPVELDVFLRGTRNYVQGTQLIAQCATLLPSGAYTLKKAAFTRITDRQLTAIPFENERSVDSEAVAAVSFDSDQGETRVFGLFEQKDEAPRKDAPFSFQLELLDEDASTCKYKFAGAQGLDDLLNIIVQAIKTHIERVAPKPFDIWFTGIRNVKLPASAGGEFESGLISLKSLKANRSGNLIQTLFDIVIDCGDHNKRNGYVTFAHKVEE